MECKSRTLLKALGNIKQTHTKKNIPTAIHSTHTQAQTLRGKKSTNATHRVKEDGEEEFSSTYALVQLTRASRVLIIEDGVSKKATCLPGQHLQTEEGERPVQTAFELCFSHCSDVLQTNVLEGMKQSLVI